MESKYGHMNDHDLLVVVAEATDRQEKHLDKINSSVSQHEKRIMKMELRREVEGELGFKPPSRKRQVVKGSMYGGGGALIVGIVLAIGHATGWW